MFKFVLKSQKTLRVVILTSLFWLVLNLVLLSVMHGEWELGRGGKGSREQQEEEKEEVLYEDEGEKAGEGIKKEDVAKRSGDSVEVKLHKQEEEDGNPKVVDQELKDGK